MRYLISVRRYHQPEVPKLRCGGIKRVERLLEGYDGGE